MKFLYYCAFSIFALTPLVSQGQLTTVVNNGSSNNRVDIVFVGDGYTASEINSTYAGHVDSMINYMFGGTIAPLPRYANFFNIHRVDVISNESGADVPQLGIVRDTALDATYRYDGQTDRLLYFSNSKANAAVGSALSGTGIDVDMRLGVVNSDVYGGGGGQWAVYAGGNSFANEVAVHELGHSFASLADEYFTAGTTHNGPEPSEVNVTADPATGKWDRWVGYNDPDSDIGPIGYYEGGKYVANGIYRPSDNSLMRSLNRPFDAIGREAVIGAIYDEVRPLDDWLSETTTLEIDGTAWVDVVDPAVIEVDWYLDGELLAFTGENLDIDLIGLAPGDYRLTAAAYDSVLDHAFTGGSLDWWRLDAAPLSQSVSWNLSISAVPEPTTYSLMIIATVAQLVRRRRVRP